MVLKMMKTGVFFCSNVEVIVDIVVNIGLDVVDANFYDVLHLVFGVIINVQVYTKPKPNTLKMSPASAKPKPND